MCEYKRTKNIFCLLLAVIVLSVNVTSCVKADYGEDKFTLAVSMDVSDVLPVSLMEAIEEETLAHGGNIIYKYAGNAENQLRDIEYMIVKKPDVIAVRPINTESIILALELIKDAGIPCILIDYCVDDEYSDLYDAFVCEDTYEEGRLQAECIKQWLDEDETRELHLGYLVGSNNKYVLPRRDALYEELGIEVPEAEEFTSWSSANAVNVTESWLQTYPEINVYACMGDIMAMGVAQALSSAGRNLDDVLIIGVDGCAGRINSLKSGEIDFTVARNVKIDAADIYNTAVALTRGETFSETIYPDSTVLLSAENVDEYYASLNEN